MRGQMEDGIDLKRIQEVYHYDTQPESKNH